MSGHAVLTNDDQNTRQLLIRAARDCFTLRGYADTSLAEILEPLGLTKGALYHHFGNKAALLEAVYTEVETELLDRVARATENVDDPWQRTLTTLDAYLEAASDPGYVRIALQEAELILSSERRRAIDEAAGIGLVRELLQNLAASGLLEPLPTEMTAKVLRGAIGQVAIAMAQSPDIEQTRAEGRAVIVALLRGLRPQTS